MKSKNRVTLIQLLLSAALAISIRVCGRVWGWNAALLHQNLTGISPFSQDFVPRVGQRYALQ